ncbi:hypothetical protein RhiJN_00799 [Ceratobasidium sp. AG-Ba]|nr:hypothetical protein RhiJN_00799 [Ceratobasidium sp. AG-Ba]
MSSSFDGAAILKYLALDADYDPSPTENPIEFLKRHMLQLPPHILVLFSQNPKATPRARTSVPAVKNRRCNYAVGEPRALDPDVLSKTDPEVWDIVNEERPQGQAIQRPAAPERDEDVEDERAWADREFQGSHIGKIGELLAELEGERARERLRTIRRQAAVARQRREETEEEFDESSDEEEEEGDATGVAGHINGPERDLRRLVRERFISGLLKEFNYDTVDWDEKWDPDDRDSEDRWFDEEEES